MNTLEIRLCKMDNVLKMMDHVNYNMLNINHLSSYKNVFKLNIAKQQNELHFSLWIFGRAFAHFTHFQRFMCAKQVQVNKYLFIRLLRSLKYRFLRQF